MDNSICLLITIYHHGELLRCAFKFTEGALPHSFCAAYWRKHEKELVAAMPLHCQSAGPVVEVNELFDVGIIEAAERNNNE